MSQITKLSLAVFFMTLIVFTVGCSSDEPPAASEADGTEAPAMPPPEQPGTPAPESGDQSALPTEGDPAGEPQPPGTATAPSPADQAKAAKIEANLVSLSVEDRALALKQQICPVSGGPLGAMGTPKKGV